MPQQNEYHEPLLPNVCHRCWNERQSEHGHLTVRGPDGEDEKVFGLGVKCYIKLIEWIVWPSLNILEEHKHATNAQEN